MLPPSLAARFPQPTALDRARERLSAAITQIEAERNAEPLYFIERLEAETDPGAFRAEMDALAAAGAWIHPAKAAALASYDLALDRVKRTRDFAAARQALVTTMDVNAILAAEPQLWPWP